MTPGGAKLRLDKWLWFARFYKTRTLAGRRVAEGAVRLNGDHVTKPATSVQVGDVLTFAIGTHIRVIQIDALGVRRGPAVEAQSLYTDLSPKPDPVREKPPENPSFEGKGRPTKRDRRKGDLLKARGADHLE